MVHVLVELAWSELKIEWKSLHMMQRSWEVQYDPWQKDYAAYAAFSLYTKVPVTAHVMMCDMKQNAGRVVVTF